MPQILLNHYYDCAKNLLLDEDGASAVEYGLLAALIGTTVIGAQTGLGNAIRAMYGTTVARVLAAMGS
ncbi:MAG: Flp family type IVb pilin [Nitrospirota bacterium]|nr:Flp family type IVb pilin [Nitrospirota bacterium]